MCGAFAACAYHGAHRGNGYNGLNREFVKNKATEAHVSSAKARGAQVAAMIILLRMGVVALAVGGADQVLPS